MATGDRFGVMIPPKDSRPFPFPRTLTIRSSFFPPGGIGQPSPSFTSGWLILGAFGTSIGSLSKFSAIGTM